MSGRMGSWGYHVPILGYHRIGAMNGDPVPTVSPEIFERQLHWLRRWGYDVITLEALVAALDRGAPALRRRVVITFDDGYEGVYRIAWPLLKQFGFPATIFVTPGDVGRPGFVSWEQVRELVRDGCAIGSHTMHHVYLPLANESQLMEEIAGSKRVLEAHVGKPVQFLSYPVGGFTATAVGIARQAGYRAACTTNRAVSRWTLDRYALRRVKVTERDAHPLVFFAKVSGYYDLFRRLKQPA